MLGKIASREFPQGESNLHGMGRKWKAFASAFVVVASAMGITAVYPLSLGLFSFHSSDDTTFAWHGAPPTSIPRAFPAVVVLANGDILVTGGLTVGSTPTATTEIFDQKLDQWRPGPTMTSKRVGHTATLLKDGTVLITGGETGTGITTSAELLNLNATSTATYSLTSMSFARANHAAVLLGNGKVLVTGGADSSGNTWRQAELYDPVKHSWQPAGNMAHARVTLSLRLLPNGNALAIGGDNQGTSEEYNPSTNGWSGLIQMRSVRYGSASTTLTDGRILVAGGLINANPISSAEIFNPSTASWSIVPSMKLARASFSLTLVSNGVLAAGSYSRLGTTNSTELFHPGNSTWSVAEPMNKSRGGQGYAVATDGSVFEIGGWSDGVITSSVEVFGPTAPVPPPPKPPPTPKPICKPIDLVPLVLECKELPGHSGNGLLAKLRAAQAKYDRGDFATCQNIMNAFYHQVRAFHNGGHMTEQHVALLYSGYASVVECMGGTPLAPIG